MLALCSALQHLHDRCGIAHRDVKPSNLLYPALEQAGAGSRGGGGGGGGERVAAQTERLSLARRLEPSAADESESSGGTPAYAAPEVLANGGEFSGAAATARWTCGLRACSCSRRSAARLLWRHVLRGVATQALPTHPDLSGRDELSSVAECVGDGQVARAPAAR